MNARLLRRGTGNKAPRNSARYGGHTDRMASRVLGAPRSLLSDLTTSTQTTNHCRSRTEALRWSNYGCDTERPECDVAERSVRTWCLAERGSCKILENRL